MAAPGPLACQEGAAEPHALVQQYCHVGQTRHRGADEARAAGGRTRVKAYAGPLLLLAPPSSFPSTPQRASPPGAPPSFPAQIEPIWEGKMGESIPSSLGRYSAQRGRPKWAFESPRCCARRGGAGAVALVHAARQPVGSARTVLVGLVSVVLLSRHYMWCGSSFVSR